MNKVTILMSTYNGENFLMEQIESIINQTYKEIEIVIRDDGSKDDTLKILKNYEQYENIKIIYGENIGCAKSFWELVKMDLDSEYYAFADQDDVWLPNKIENAIKRLEIEKLNIPCLYCTNTIVVNSQLNIISDDVSEEEIELDFCSSLIKAVSPGCTFVFNRKASEILKMYVIRGCDIHDWVTHRIIACFGKVIYSRNSQILYRQHSNNLIGFQKKNLKYIVKKISNIKKNAGLRSSFASDLLIQYPKCINVLNSELLYDLSNYTKDKKIKKKIIKLYKNKFDWRTFFWLKKMFKKDIV